MAKSQPYKWEPEPEPDEGAEIKVIIRRNADGVTREWLPGFKWHGAFIWDEGNFACDCNRGQFFDEAGGDGDDEDDEIPCGDGAYSVRVETKSSGRVLYQDDEF